MRDDQRDPGSIQFGPFEFDTQTGRLTRRGFAQRLENLPGRALAYLIEHNDRLVARSELIQVLWPDVEHGDFEHRLDKVLSKLRMALEDSPANPRYIETVRGRGVRFIAEPPPAQVTGAGEGMSPVEATENMATATSIHTAPYREGQGLEGAVPLSGRRTGWGIKTRLAVGLALLVVSVSFARYQVHRHQQGVQASVQRDTRQSVVVLGLRPADEAFYDNWITAGTNFWLSEDLQANGQLRVLPDLAVSDLREKIPSGMGDGLPRELLEAVRERTGADLVIFGWYQVEDGENETAWRIQLRAQETRGAEEVRRANALGPQARGATMLRSAQAELFPTSGGTGFGHEPGSLGQGELPKSAAVARLYVEGLLALRQKLDPMEASALLSRAAELEPAYAFTHAQLASASLQLGLQRKAAAEFELAMRDFREMNPRQQTEMLALRCEIGSDWGTASDVYAKLAEQYPADIEYKLERADAQIAMGSGSAALLTLEQIRASGGQAFGSTQAALLRARAEGSTGNFIGQYDAANQAEAEARSARQPLLTAMAMTQEANAQFTLGHWKTAQGLWQHALDIFDMQGDRRDMAEVLYEQGKLYWLTHQPVMARSTLERSVELGRKYREDAVLAAALAYLGNVIMYSRADPNVDIDKLQRLFSEADAIYKRDGNLAGQGQVMGLAGDLAMCRSRYAEANEDYAKGLKYSSAANDKSSIANRFLDLGIVASEVADNAAAEDDYKKAVVAYRALGQIDRVALAQNRLANLVFREGQIDYAISLSADSLRLMQSVGYVDNGIMEDLSRFEDERDAARAEMLARQSIEASTDKTDTREIAGRYIVLAEAQLAMGKLQDAKSSVRRAFELHPVLTHHIEASEMLSVRAEVERQSGDLSAARSDLQRALSICRTYGSKRYEMPVRLNLAGVRLQIHEPLARDEMLHVEQDSQKLGYLLVSRKAQGYLQAGASGPLEPGVWVP